MSHHSGWNDYYGYKMCPCKDCELRHFRCHSSCEMYAEWRKSVDAQHSDEVLEAKAASDFVKVVGGHAINGSRTYCIRRKDENA